MKKTGRLVAFLTAVIIGIGSMAIGVDSVAVYAATSDEEIIQAAKDLFEKQRMYAGNNYEAFASLYSETDDATISAEYDSYTAMEWSPSQFDKEWDKVILNEEPYYIVNLVYYTVSGTHPNTNKENATVLIGITNIDGEWKVNSSENLANKFYSVTNLATEGFYKARENSRNNMFFDGAFMYLSNSAVFEGCNSNSIIYAYQQEDGSVSVGVWLSNGTAGNIYYKSGELSLTDSSIGTIFDITTEIKTSVVAGSNRVVEIHIPAEQILTGTQTWGTVSGSTDIRYNG